MKNILYIFLGMIAVTSVRAQQMTLTSPIQDIQHIWNPAFTAPGTMMDMSVYYRRQWIGFDGAPSTGVASIQYPFVDMNMSAAAMIISDKTGPVSKTGLQFNYAYKLKELLGRDDQLSIGINTFLYQYKIDPTDLVTFIKDEPLITAGRQTKFIPSFGAGFAYFSSTEEYEGDNIFYVGFSALQLTAQNVFLEEGNAKRERHFFVNMGTKIFGYNHYVEPSLQVNYVNPELIDYVLGAKFELEETFWAGLSYSSINDLSVNGGVILDDVGGRYTKLKLGAVASINSGAIMSAGASFEFFASYTMDLD